MAHESGIHQVPDRLMADTQALLRFSKTLEYAFHLFLRPVLNFLYRLALTYPSESVQLNIEGWLKGPTNKVKEVVPGEITGPIVPMELSLCVLLAGY